MRENLTYGIDEGELEEIKIKSCSLLYKSIDCILNCSSESIGIT
jgi:hypothetical protein